MMATKTSHRRVAAKRKRAETVDQMLARTGAHEVNYFGGKAGGPPQARNYGSYTPTSRDSGGL